MIMIISHAKSITTNLEVSLLKELQEERKGFALGAGEEADAGGGAGEYGGESVHLLSKWSGATTSWFF